MWSSSSLPLHGLYSERAPLLLQLHGADEAWFVVVWMGQEEDDFGGL